MRDTSPHRGVGARRDLHDARSWGARRIAHRASGMVPRVAVERRAAAVWAPGERPSFVGVAAWVVVVAALRDDDDDADDDN